MRVLPVLDSSHIVRHVVRPIVRPAHASGAHRTNTLSLPSSLPLLSVPHPPGRSQRLKLLFHSPNAPSSDLQRTAVDIRRFPAPFVDRFRGFGGSAENLADRLKSSRIRLSKRGFGRARRGESKAKVPLTEDADAQPREKAGRLERLVPQAFSKPCRTCAPFLRLKTRKTISLHSPPILEGPKP